MTSLALTGITQWVYQLVLFLTVMEVLTRYGWVIVGVAAVGYLIWRRTTPILNKLVEDRQLASAKKGLGECLPFLDFAPLYYIVG